MELEIASKRKAPLRPNEAACRSAPDLIHLRGRSTRPQGAAVGKLELSQPNLSLERSFAFSASVSRSRAGACVCSEVSSRRAAAVTSATALSKASALACDGLLKPERLRTNCSAEAWISSPVAGGSKLNSVLMLRHIAFSPDPRA